MGKVIRLGAEWKVAAMEVTKKVSGAVLAGPVSPKMGLVRGRKAQVTSESQAA